MPTKVELEVENKIAQDAIRAVKPQFLENGQVAPLREKLQGIIDGGGVTAENYPTVRELIRGLALYLDFDEFSKYDEPIKP